MKQFSVPFTIVSAHRKDFVLERCYAKKRETYRLTIPPAHKFIEPLTIRFEGDAEKLDFDLEIEIGQGTEAVILEEWGHPVTSPTISYSCRTTCHPDSKLTTLILNDLPRQAEMTEDRLTHVLKDARSQLFHYQLGSKKFKSHLIQSASGKGAEAISNTVVNSDDTQNLSFRVEHRHQQALSRGEIRMKGVARHQATLNFDGLVQIEKNGAGTAAYLKQEILNLSPFTSVRAKPGLKIETNDVKAGHSAAIRNLNEEDLYYFSARGIESETAKKLLITGFLESELKELSVWYNPAALRTHL